MDTVMGSCSPEATVGLQYSLTFAYPFQLELKIFLYTSRFIPVTLVYEIRGIGENQVE